MKFTIGLKKCLKKFNFGSLFLESSFGVIMIVILSIIFISTFKGTEFLSKHNLHSILRASSLWILISLSQIMVLVIGQMNLSVGAIGGLSAIVAGYLFQHTGFPIIVVVLLGLLMGLICGFINGIIITKTGINPFIVTLGTFSVFLGVNYGITRALPFTEIPSSFISIATTRIAGIIPMMFLIMLGVAAMCHILFNFTVFGRKILATGGNEEAAIFSGINTQNIVLKAHILSGFFAGLAGIIYVSRLGSAHPLIGQNWLLMSFAISIIGGTSLAGGKVSIVGAIFGGIFMTLISNGLVLFRVDIFWEESFLGMALLIAIGMDRLRSFYAERKYF